MEITYQNLIKNSFVEHANLTLQNKETLTYYIDLTNGLHYLERFPVIQYGSIQTENLTIYTVAHDKSKINFIRDTFKKLDEIIDLDFEEMSHNNGSMLDIYNINYSSSFDDYTLGQAIAQRSKNGSWWEILWREIKTNGEIDIDNDLNTIVHEIGHALGLGHPFDNPHDERLNSSDTIMSYNKNPDGWNTWYSKVDLNALISIWGRENDNGSIKYNKNRFDYTYKRNKDNQYFINTEIGFEEITNIESLIFKDQSINVNQDIIGVFNLIDGIDGITGKIYRLYNAAFARFPDKAGLEYWINTNTSDIDSYKNTAISFVQSEEFERLYGKNQSNKNYVTSLYNNVLSRDPDDEGFDYWENQLITNKESRSDVLTGFSESLENKIIFSTQTNIF